MTAVRVSRAFLYAVAVLVMATGCGAGFYVLILLSATVIGA